MNNLMKGFNSKLVIAEEKIRTLEDRSGENIQKCAL